MKYMNCNKQVKTRWIQGSKENFSIFSGVTSKASPGPVNIGRICRFVSLKKNVCKSERIIENQREEKFTLNKMRKKN